MRTIINFIKRILGIKEPVKTDVSGLNANQEYFDSLGKSNWN